ncbi:MAG: hypothetical protein KF700_04485 [Hyphomonadaceae bacterium]|nr:hypothetical protein [Hyphomonadaceae bacterium]
MRTWGMLGGLSIALAACGEADQSQRAQAPAPFLDLVCGAFADASAASLAGEYGAANIALETLQGPEGETYVASVLYPADPARRLEIVWRDAARSTPATVMVRGESAWVGDNGLRVGDSLERVQELNGAVFSLWGFQWDYGGWVSEWNGGQFAPHDGCMTRVRFEARAQNPRALGDREFSSEDATMRGADPVVAAFGLAFAER